MRSCSAPVNLARACRALALIATLAVLGPSAGAQAVDESISVATLQEQAASQTAGALQVQVSAWTARVEQLRDEAATARAAATDDAGKAAAADLDARLEASSERLLALVRVLEEKGGEAGEARAVLLEVRGVDAENLSVGALTSLGSRWVAQARDWAVEELPGIVVRLLVALFVLLVFKLLANVAGRITARALSASKLKVTDLLQRFFVGIASKTVFIFGVLFAIRTIGVDLGPVLAGVGIVGFVVGFALQDTLANFAAGVMILLYHPFDIGHVIEAAGSMGKVTDLNLVSTTLLTPDNRRIIIPNGKIWGGTILNVTAHSTRRVDLDVGIGYGDDIDRALAICKRVVEAHPLVLADPAPAYFVAKLGDSSVDLAMRPWCKTGDWFAVSNELRKAIKQAFDAEGVSIPFPQRDVHLFQQPLPQA